MKYTVKTMLAAMLLCLCAAGVAQPAKPGVTAVQKFKPPKVKTMLGRCVDSMAITRDEARQLLSLPLKISDAKGTAYTVYAYQLAYRRSVVTEDEATGKVLPATSLVSDQFKTTPLPELWQQNIKATIKPGELLYFFDVIVKDAQGRLFFAPELKISIR